MTRGTTWLRRAQRGGQLLAGLLVAGLLGQLGSMTRVHAAVMPHPPTLDDCWLAPPPLTRTIQLDRLVPATPVPAADAVPLAAGSTAPRLTLQGILFSETPKAYVVDENTHQTLTVRPGDRVGSVTIRAIRDRTVLIEREGETYELRL